MAKLEGKLPFVGAVYQHRESGTKIRITARERIRGHQETILAYQYEKTGNVDSCSASGFYDIYKRCKDGTAFHIEEGWNE